MIFKVCLDKPRHKRNIAKFREHTLARENVGEQIGVIEVSVGVA